MARSQLLRKAEMQGRSQKVLGGGGRKWGVVNKLGRAQQQDGCDAEQFTAQCIETHGGGDDGVNV